MSSPSALEILTSKETNSVFLFLCVLQVSVVLSLRGAAGLQWVRPAAWCRRGQRRDARRADARPAGQKGKYEFCSNTRWGPDRAQWRRCVSKCRFIGGSPAARRLAIWIGPAQPGPVWPGARCARYARQSALHMLPASRQPGRGPAVARRTEHYTGPGARRRRQRPSGPTRACVQQGWFPIRPERKGVSAVSRG